MSAVVDSLRVESLLDIVECMLHVGETMVPFSVDTRGPATGRAATNLRVDLSGSRSPTASRTGSTRREAQRHRLDRAVQSRFETAVRGELARGGSASATFLGTSTRAKVTSSGPCRQPCWIWIQRERADGRRRSCRYRAACCAPTPRSARSGPTDTRRPGESCRATRRRPRHTCTSVPTTTVVLMSTPTETPPAQADRSTVSPAPRPVGAAAESRRPGDPRSPAPCEPPHYRPERPSPTQMRATPSRSPAQATPAITSTFYKTTRLLKQAISKPFRHHPGGPALQSGRRRSAARQSELGQRRVPVSHAGGPAKYRSRPSWSNVTS